MVFRSVLSPKWAPIKEKIANFAGTRLSPVDFFSYDLRFPYPL